MNPLAVWVPFADQVIRGRETDWATWSRRALLETVAAEHWEPAMMRLRAPSRSPLGDSNWSFILAGGVLMRGRIGVAEDER